MAATFSIISHRVGEGGTKNGTEVLRIQQLLTLVGKNPRYNNDGAWGKGEKSTTLKSWLAYQEEKGWRAQNYIDPMDAEDRLGTLAFDAGVTLYVPASARSATALTIAYSVFVGEKIPYGWVHPKTKKKYGAGTKLTWGFQDRPYSIIFTTTAENHPVQFDVDSGETRSTNCTAFANLVLSVWQQGNAHSAPYDVSQGVGGLGAIQLGPRYAMPAVLTSKGTDVFTDLDELKENLQADRIYHMGLCSDKAGTIHHDTAVLNNEVYQANIPGAGPGPVYKIGLDEQWDILSCNAVRLFGPGPY